MNTTEPNMHNTNSVGKVSNQILSKIDFNSSNQCNQELLDDQIKFKFTQELAPLYSPTEGKAADGRKVSAINSPVSITVLRRSQLHAVCHIVWLKMMTVVKLVLDLISAILAVTSVAVMLMYHNQ